MLSKVRCYKHHLFTTTDYTRPKIDHFQNIHANQGTLLKTLEWKTRREITEKNPLSWNTRKSWNTGLQLGPDLSCNSDTRWAMGGKSSAQPLGAPECGVEQEEGERVEGARLRGSSLLRMSNAACAPAPSLQAFICPTPQQDTPYLHSQPAISP